MLHISVSTIVHVTSHADNDDDIYVSHIFLVNNYSLDGRRGKVFLFMAHLSNGDIPLMGHMLNVGSIPYEGVARL
jgi:hypothetical protein